MDKMEIKKKEDDEQLKMLVVTLQLVEF